MNLHLYTLIQLSVISVLVEGYNFTPILNVRNEPNNIYYWWNEQNRKERAKNWTLWNASEWGIQEEDDESILTKDERFVKLLSMNESRCGQFLTNQMYVHTYGEGCCGSRVSKAADISRAARIVTFPESMVSMISLVSLREAVSVEWKGWKTGRNGKVRKEASQSQAFQYFANSVQIGNRSEIWRIWFGEPGLLQKRCNESMFEFWWESSLVKRQVGKVRYENRECAGAWLEQRCRNIIKWWWFAKHRVEQFCHFGWSDRCEVIECLSSVGFVKSKWRWRITEFGGYGEFERDNFLTEERSQRVSQWFGNCWWKLFCRGGRVKNGFNSCPEWFGFLEHLLMRSRLNTACDFMIKSLAVQHVARYARRSGSAFEVFQHSSSLNVGEDEVTAGRPDIDQLKLKRVVGVAVDMQNAVAWWCRTIFLSLDGCQILFRSRWVRVWRSHCHPLGCEVMGLCWQWTMCSTPRRKFYVGPGLTSTPPMINSSNVNKLARVRRRQWNGGCCNIANDTSFVRKR